MCALHTLLGPRELEFEPVPEHSSSALVHKPQP